MSSDMESKEGTKVPAIHLVERNPGVRRVAVTEAEWETGYWAVTQEAAGRLIGGDLYLHAKQLAPSHFGGKILSFRVHSEPGNDKMDGRIVFRIQASMAHKNFRTPKDGWGNDKKLVW